MHSHGIFSHVAPDMEALDIWLFYAINNGWSSGPLDMVMPVVTSTQVWRPIYALGLVLLLWRGGSKGRWCAAALIVCVALTDPLSNHLLKETILRLRPYDALGGVHQLVGSGGGSFPSNHALNNAAAATILSVFYTKWAPLCWGIAILIGISRIYVGVHYPSDVIAGLAIGALAGFGVARITLVLRGKLSK